MDKNSPEFKALKAKWDKKLKDSGFDDIEQDEDTLKRWHKQDFALAVAKGWYGSFSAYYEVAGRFLHEHKFDSDFEKKVWAEHAEGYPIREIVKRFSEAGVKTYKREVHETLQKLTSIMTGKLKSSK